METTINKPKLTALAYIMYFFAGSTVILPGVLMSYIASSFKVDLASIGSAYGNFGFGILISIILGGFLTRHLGLKRQLIATFFLLAASTFTLCTYQNLQIFTFSIFGLGLCCGLFIAAANFILVHLYNDAERHSKLIRLDFLFSFGSLLYPIAAGHLLADGLAWYHVYTSIFIIGAIIFLMTLLSKFPDFDLAHQKAKASKAQDKADKTYVSFPWVHVGVVALACFFYTSSEISFSFWIVDFIHTHLESPMKIASIALTVFWVSVAIGRFLSSYLIKMVPFNKFILGSILLAVVAFYAVLQSSQMNALFILIAIMGLGYSSLYPSIISHGTLLVKNASPRLVSFFLTAGTLGFMTAAELSSSIQKLHGSKYALVGSLGFLMLVFAMMAISFTMEKHKRERAGK